jgi:bifunctional non-homologous end joining protein LigD
MGTQGRPAHPPPLPLLAPMLAVTAAAMPHDQRQFSFEPKLDGFRALAYLDHGRLVVRSRSGKAMHPWLPELAQLAETVAPHGRLILDGEVVALVDGKPSFEALQQRMRTRRPGPAGAAVVLCLFDVLWQGDQPLLRRPYQQRRAMLEDLRLAGPNYQVVPAVVGEGDAMLTAVAAQELEGVVAKLLTSTYRPGVRSSAWIKVFNRRRLRLLVGGFVPGQRGDLDALLVGDPDPTGETLRFAARIDRGLSPAARRRLAALLAPLRTPESPFTTPVAAGGWGRAPGPPPQFVRPVVAVEVECVGREPSGRLRHPAYVGPA